jgi:hypothetical protein
VVGSSGETDVAKVTTSPADRQTVLPPGWQPRQGLALVTGIAFVIAGAAGFVITGFRGFADHHSGQTLLGLEVNPLHNLIHLLLGLAGLVFWRTLEMARVYGWLLLSGYAAVFVYGLFAVENDDINILSINAADNWFHLGSALLGLLIVVLPERDRAESATESSMGRHQL